MLHKRPATKLRRLIYVLITAASIVLVISGFAGAHPLGNFTINHFARLDVGVQRIRVQYVIDMAEIPAFQELQGIKTGDETPSVEELKVYASQAAAKLADGILINIDGASVPISAVQSTASLPTGAGGLPTLRIECAFEGAFDSTGPFHRLKFEDTNYRDRMGWREIAAIPASGVNIFDSSAFGNTLTDALKAYPEDSISAPLDERYAELSFGRGVAPSGAKILRMRDGHPVVQQRDRLAELIAVPELTPLVSLLGLLAALALGALHALSPGHGKTVVGAYLVGSRGTARHAAFLGLTVTLTHTAGVFALGVATLFASRYIVPERVFPVLSFVSGAIVLTIGLTLFIRRWRATLERSQHHNVGDHDHNHPYSHAHEHAHNTSLVDSHGEREHSHLPPGADGSPITWRSLLALGISGGLLPCPSALVVMLSAISFHRVGYGLLLVITFSIGLAATLTAVGLIFVYAARLMKRPLGSGRLVRVLPVASAFVIACAGGAICYEALSSSGLSFVALFARLPGLFTNSISPGTPISTASVLLFGLVFGLKHAVEADHLAAVSTIVSERKSVFSSSLVGGLWGIGHTVSLFVAGVSVLLLNLKIGERTALGLEFCVAVMLVALGANALRKLLRGGTLHAHSHRHGKHAHLHPHIHEELAKARKQPQDTHHDLTLNARPLLVGMVHGLAGSAALMLLVVSTVSTRAIGLAFIAVFGLGSIGGMMVMSALVSMPFRFTANRFKRAHRAVQILAAIFSLGLGMMMAYQIGFLDGLLA
jgi:nickel/cobalt transporter (NicO) family protein